MKLDVEALRYLSKDDLRVLTSVEMGQKNVRWRLGVTDHIAYSHIKYLKQFLWNLFYGTFVCVKSLWLTTLK